MLIKYNYRFSSKHFYILFLAVLGLHCCTGFSLIVVHGLLIVVASSVVEHGLSCSMARGAEEIS